MSETKAQVIPIEAPDDDFAYERFLATLPDIEEAESTKDLNLVRDGDPEVASGIWDAEMRAFIDSMSLKTMFFTEDWIFICIDKIASKLAHQPLRVVRKVTQKSGKTRTEPIPNHPVQKLLEKPNLYQDMTSFTYTSLVDLMVLGNTTIWHSEATNQLIGIPAELVRLDFDRNGFLSRYVVQQWWGSETNVPWKAGLTFDAAQIIHVRRPNPSSLLWGMSPLIPGRKCILFNRYSSEFLVNFYLKGATPQMALSLDKEANEKNALRLLRSFEQAYTGRKNQRRAMVLPKGVTANPLTQSLADQELKEYVNINRETIINILGVPKHELSLAEAGSLGSEEAKEAVRGFWESVLKPTGKMYTGALSMKLAQDLGPNCFIEFDLSEVQALRDDEVKKAGLAKEMLFTHTLNEVRQELYELPPLPGGDATPQGPQKAPAAPAMGEPKQDGFGGQPTPWAAVQPSQVGNGAGGPPQPYTDPRYSKQPSADPRQQLGDAEPEKTPEDAPHDPVKKARANALKTGHDGWFNRRQEKATQGMASRQDAMHKLALGHFVDTAAASVKTVKRFLTQKSYVPARAKSGEAPMRRVATVAVVHEGKILMGKRRDNGKHTFPGGHANEGENLHAAAVRELAEETGIQADPADVRPMGEAQVVTNDKGEKLQVQPFLHEPGEKARTTMRDDPDGEVERWLWYDANELPKHVQENLHVPAERNVLMHALGMSSPGASETTVKTKAAGDDPNSTKRPKPIPRSQVLNKAELRKALTKAYSEYEEKWINDSVKILEGTVDLGYDLQLDVPFKLPSTNELAALRAEGAEGRRATLEDRELKTFSRMSETTTDQVLNVIDQGVENGKTVQEIAEDIAENFRNVDNIDGRAMTIARTETMTALSMGQQAALEDAKTVIPNLKKMWVSTHDERTRGDEKAGFGPASPGFKPGDPDHRELDGELVGADEAFSNGLLYPRDPKGGAGDVINCRCAWVMMPEDQAK